MSHPNVDQEKLFQLSNQSLGKFGQTTPDQRAAREIALSALENGQEITGVYNPQTDEYVIAIGDNRIPVSPEVAAEILGTKSLPQPSKR